MSMQWLQKMWDTLNVVAEKVLFAPAVRRMVNGAAYVLLPLVLISLLLLEYTIPGGVYAAAEKAGSLAQLILLVILFMKPVGVVFGIRILKRALIYRQQMGVAMLYLALFHFIVMVIPERVFDPTYYTWRNHVLYGAVALVITVALGVTSNRYAQRVLRRNWKRLHYAAYPLLFFVLLHASMASGEWAKVALLVPLFALLKILELRRVKITLPVISHI